MIIGLCGYAQSGKDTAAKHLTGFRRLAFADKLKADLSGFILTFYGFSIYNCTPEQKEMIRPLMIAHGECKRRQDPSHWLKPIQRVIEDSCKEDGFVITDVRYLNEAKMILNAGGLIIYLDRGGAPASNEEARSIREILDVIEPPRVLNDDEPVVLAQRVLTTAIRKQGRPPASLLAVLSNMREPCPAD